MTCTLCGSQEHARSACPLAEGLTTRYLLTAVGVILASGIVSAVCLFALIVGLSPAQAEPGLRMSYEIAKP